MGSGHDERTEKRPAVTQSVCGVLLPAALFTFLIALLPGSGIAQQAAIIGAKPIAIENVTNIKEQPLALLAKFPDAGPAMARYVAQQLTQQPAMVDALLSIVNDTSPEQASAMGAGMVRAVRALGPKQANSARVITEKVMRSDNRYLTTTFASLGPHYRANAAFVSPANLPPRAVAATGNMGAGIGAAWRVGLAENKNMMDYNLHGDQAGCLYYSYSNEITHCRGTIVAMMTSNADQNGAVSISPTI